MGQKKDRGNVAITATVWLLPSLGFKKQKHNTLWL
jgi:hypothetical protein